MFDIKISALPSAAVVNPADIVVLNQDGTTKTAAQSLIVAGLATTDQLSGLASTSQLSGFATTKQIVGIAVTSQLSGFATTDQISGFTNSAQVQSLTSAQIAAITPGSIGAASTAQLSAYVPKTGATMEGRLVMAATTDQAKANIGGFLTGAAAPASVIPGDVWVSNQSKLSFSPSTGVTVNVAGLSQANTFNQTQTIGVGGAVTSIAVSNNGTGRAATFAANSTAPAVAITQTGTGAALSVDSKGVLFYDGSIQSSATGHFQARLASTTHHPGTSNIGVTPNTFTYETFGTPQCDGRNIALNDLIVFTSQADPTQNGPWLVTTMNVGGVSGAVLTRPAWFSGSSVKQGITINIGEGLTRFGQILNVGKTLNGLIAVGSDSIVVSVSNYNQNALTTAQIAGFATTTQLGGYATTTQIVGLATTAQLSGFATTAQLDGYATTTQISTLQPALTSAAPLAISGGGTGATTAVAALTSLGALSATATASGDLSGNYPNPTVAKIQGQAVSANAPSSGQVLTWNGSSWIATAPAAGGSGGGGILFYLNQGTTPDAPAPAGAKELGRVAEVAQTTVTSGTLSTGVWTDIAGFVSDTLDPNLQDIPAGIFDFNVWAKSDANANAPTSLRVQINKWDGTTSTLIATSGTAIISNNGTTVQTAISVVIPQTDVSPSDRLYIVLQAQPAAAGHTITVDFGNGTPSHVHTTIPSVGGTGVIKVIDGVPQNPASLITDSDVSTSAPLALNKIQMSQVSVSAGAGLTGGGDLSASRTIALATTGIAAISGAGSSVAVPVISANIYGQITAITTEAIAVGGSGTVTSITAGTGLSGGTITASGTIALETAGPGALSGVGSSAAVPIISVDAYGRISALQTASLSALGGGTVTSIAMTSQVSGLSFTPTSAITNNGTFNLTGTLDIAGGGTGASTAAAALSNLGGITSTSLEGLATTTQLSAYQTALTSAAPLAISLGGTGAITAIAAMTALGNMHFAGGWSQTSVVLGTMDTAVTPNTFTVTTPGALSVDAGSPAAGDILVFVSQPTGSQHLARDNGPWIVVNPGAVGIQATLVRPDWFSGIVKTGMLVSNQYGASRTGVTYALQGPNTTTIGNFIDVGTDVISVIAAYQRASGATLGTNTFGSRQTYAVNNTTQNPISLSTAAATLLSTQQLGAIEWDNTQLYITSSTQFSALNRNAIATAAVLINAQTGTTFTPALTDAGKLITANNAAAISLTIPTDASVNFPIGTQLLVMQLDLGQVTVAAVTPGTTTVNSKNGTKTSGQYAIISLIKVAANSWIVGGDATV